MTAFAVLFAAQLACAPTFEVPKPGAVKPTGWLQDVMRAARDGYTAHMDEVDEQFRRAWAETMQPRGKDVHWWANPGSWSAEGGAYWFEGLVRMAFQLDDPKLKMMVSNRLETVLSKTTPDSWGFLWWLRRDNPEDVKAMKGDAFLLANSEKLVDTVGAWYEATGDKRAERALRTAFSGAAFEIYKPVRGAFEAWRLTGDEAIARQLDEQVRLGHAEDRYSKMCGRYGEMPSKYLDETLWIKYRHEQMFKMSTRHGIGASRGITRMLRLYQWSGDTALLRVVRAWCAFLDAHCRLPFGQMVMDEEWGWAGPNRATETCTAACENAMRISLLSALGEGTWADDVEESVFNVGANCVTADFSLHVYMQQPNRTKACDLSDCSHGGDGLGPECWTEHGRYARKHNPLCCTAGLNRIWPDFVQAMWLTARDGGVAAAMFGPCTFESACAGGRFAVRETTDYPFSDTVRFTVEDAPSAALPFSVRIPRWCGAFELAVNGVRTDVRPEKGFARLVRTWRTGDVVTLRVPMAPRYATMTDLNGCARGEPAKRYGYLKLGPLLFAKRLPMKDVNTPLEPDAPLPVLSSAAAARAKVVRSPMPAHWNWAADAPVRLRLADAEGRPLELVPYGTAKFRISMFPVRDSPSEARACAEFSVASVFSDHMVVQRDRPVRVWGRAPRGRRVTVTFADAKAEAVAGTDGEWCVELPALPACKEGRTLTVTAREIGQTGKSSEQTIAFADILVGDVWLMAGQSNMEFPFRKSIGAAEWASKADGCRNIRQLRVRQARAVLPRTDAACDGWRVCTSNALMTTDVSGVGYACVCELNESTGIPQGIIETHWGGCLIEPFISLEGYRSVPDLAVPYVSDIERARTRHSRDRFLWKERQDKILDYADYLKRCRAECRDSDLLPFKHIAFEGFDPFYGTAYNAMIAPLTRLPVAGCFWYQGESNVGCRIYDKLMKALAFGWRTAWGEDFPIYVCQRSSVEKAVIDLSKNNVCARFRDLQRRMIPGLGKSGLVVTTDVGADYEHPENKIDVGLRCARWALRDLYGRDVVPTGPMFKGFVREGSRLRVSFDFAKGLMAAEKDPRAPGVPPVRKATNKVEGFAVYGEDGQWHLASAEIDGETVVVWSEGVKHPKELRYAHFSNVIGLADLYNGEGLPAAAFRTDNQDWQNK